MLTSLTDNIKSYILIYFCNDNIYDEVNHERSDMIQQPNTENSPLQKNPQKHLYTYTYLNYLPENKIAYLLI